MTLDETIKHCEEVAEAEEQKYKEWRGDYSHLKKIDSCLECANEQRQLAEWLKELKSLKEKDEPKLVIYSGDGYADGKMVYDWADCPSCNFSIEESDADWEMPYCPSCGQRLRW